MDEKHLNSEIERMAASDESTDMEKGGSKTPIATEHERRPSYLDNDSPFPGVFHGLLTDDIPRMPSMAVEANKAEKKLTLGSALKLYGKAIGWSAAISFAIIMEGFGTALLNSFFGFPAFQRQYGVRVTDTDFEIPVKWQTGLSNAAAASAVVGILANGLLTARFGYRRTMLGSLAFLSLAVFAIFFGYNLHIILAGQILCGLSWGVFSTLTTTYAAEVLPTNLRGYLIASVNLCWLLGQVIAAGTLRGFITMDSEWSYRIPFALQWVFVVIVVILTLLAPESPWWLVQRNRPDEARKVLKRLTRSTNTDFNAESAVAMMCHTDAVEKKLSGRDRVGTTSYLECFRGTNLRRTEIACMVFMIQNASGLPLISFAAYFYNKIGFSQKQAFDLTVSMQSTGIVGNLIAFVLMRYIGRRTLYLCGLSFQLLILLVAGTISCFNETPATLWAMAGLVIVFILVFDIAVGPMTYCLVAELPSARLRVKSVALARVSYNLCALVTNVLQTNMLNTLSWGWRGKSCFFWAGVCALSLAYCWWRLPETKGLTYLELDLLFEKRAKARKFAVVQRQLVETGYFETDGERDRPRWVEGGRVGSSAAAVVGD